MQQAKFEQIVQKINPDYTLLRLWQLEGGISAQVTGLEVLLPDGETKKLLVRRHGDNDFKGNPHIAKQEFELLQFLQAEGIPVATPYFLDESDTLFGRPYLVLEYVEGHTQFEPVNLDNFILQFATNLAKIHGVNLSQSGLSLRYTRDDLYQAYSGEKRENPDEALQATGVVHDCTQEAMRSPDSVTEQDSHLIKQEICIRETLAKARPLVQVNPSALLHGDYWLGNILWKATGIVDERTHNSEKPITERGRHLIKEEEQLVAIIDWEDAVLGDPLADLANSRLEILWALGNSAMNDFTAQYQALMRHLNYDHLPYWDLWAALRPIAEFSDWADNEETRQLWRERHFWFSGQAIEALHI